ncbi:Nlrc3 [Symbiodinium sp. CCMP2592]|nr:Nlrc3 [Symbiodinium sp. CCMP2592]
MAPKYNWTIRGKYGHWEEVTRGNDDAGAGPQSWDDAGAWSQRRDNGAWSQWRGDARAWSARGDGGAATSSATPKATPPPPPPAEAPMPPPAMPPPAMPPPAMPPPPMPPQEPKARPAAAKPKPAAKKAIAKPRSRGGSQNHREYERWKEDHARMQRAEFALQQCEAALQEAQYENWALEISCEKLQEANSNFSVHLQRAQDSLQNEKERNQRLLVDISKSMHQKTEAETKHAELEKKFIKSMTDKDKIKEDKIMELKAEHKKDLGVKEAETRKALDNIDALKRDFQSYKEAATKELRHERSEKAGGWVLTSSGSRYAEACSCSCVRARCCITGTCYQERYQLLCSNFERQWIEAWFQPSWLMLQ